MLEFAAVAHNAAVAHQRVGAQIGPRHELAILADPDGPLCDDAGVDDCAFAAMYVPRMVAFS